MLCHFAWGDDDEQHYGKPVYYIDKDELMADPEQQSYYFAGEQLSPCAASCRMCVSVFWLSDSCASCMS